MDNNGLHDCLNVLSLFDGISYVMPELSEGGEKNAE